MYCLENFLAFELLNIQQFERQGSLRDEQSVGEINPLFALEPNADTQHAGAHLIRST
jgi:hypothetical protein